jgi:hypothetical protein
MSGFFSSAMSLAGDMQGVKDRLPGSLMAIREGVNSKIGDRRSFKTPNGTRDIVELGPIGKSANIIKVRCSATNEEFVVKRLAMATEVNNQNGNPGLVSVEAMEALAQRADLIASLPQNPSIVQCFGVQADNNGKVPAKVVLMELCGESLQDYMAKDGMKSDDQLHVLRDVAEGLFCLHTAELGSVVHGSIDTEHIYRDNKSGVWKLGSFGAAERSSETAKDIWQLGLLLLTVLFGSTSFDKDSDGSNTTSEEVHNSIVSSIPSGRVLTNMEGRLVLMISWLLTAEPSKRPTAEQVVLAVGKLGEMPAPALALALPNHTRKQFRALCMSFVRRTICEAIDNIEGSDRRILINKYGEEALRNPANLPTSVKQGALSTEQHTYIRVIQSFLPGEVNNNTLSPDVKSLSEALARAASEMGDSKADCKEASEGRAPSDLLGFQEAPKTEKVNQAPKAPEAAGSLLDLADLAPSPSQQPPKINADAGLDLLQMGVAPSSQVTDTKPNALDALQGNLGDLFSNPTPQPMATPCSDFSALASQPAAQPAMAQPGMHPVMAAFNMPAPQQGAFGMMPAQNPSGPQQTPYMMPNQYAPPMQPNRMQPAPMTSPMLMNPQANGSAGYPTSTTQVAPPQKQTVFSAPVQKEEKKDPFAGLVGF